MNIHPRRPSPYQRPASHRVSDDDADDDDDVNASTEPQPAITNAARRGAVFKTRRRDVVTSISTAQLTSDKRSLCSLFRSRKNDNGTALEWRRTNSAYCQPLSMRHIFRFFCATFSMYILLCLSHQPLEELVIFAFRTGLHSFLARLTWELCLCTS